MKRREVVVSDLWKNHSSPIPELVDFACRFSSKLLVNSGNMQANMKSMMGMAVFNIMPGMEVEITAEGADEEEAIGAVEKFLTGESQ